MEQKLKYLKSAVFETLEKSNTIEQVIARYCRRRIDRLLKKIDVSTAATVAEISHEYLSRTSSLKIEVIANDARHRIQTAVEKDDLSILLASYDNKGLMALAATHLKASRLIDFESWLARVLRNKSQPRLTAAIKSTLPNIQAA